MKLIVTGSRDWCEELDIWTALRVFSRYKVGKIELVHGDCPTGADKFADDWGLFNLRPEWIHRYPADWGKHGRAAGPIRNQQMIDENLNADYVLAFPLGVSRGTRGCMEYAASKGLTVVNLGDK